MFQDKRKRPTVDVGQDEVKNLFNMGEKEEDRWTVPEMPASTRWAGTTSP